ncbi:MAG: hypothetical protein AVDCRST_MAG95-2470 [uncultured Adhaeribacter sp.]|uniref:Uncharacterized protein n=1 Tax=uncultured Adhaeribacter sp. TaxID=448109 RepID=A0A6J4J0W1_9BACT|nr:MAG: hypothetical protein AVDCRST_MAG95-2470 [uncultured Adhaeribacter sp.]
MVLVYVELRPAGVYSYQKPLLEKLKQRFPAGVYLDLDAFSEDYLTAQAGRLLAEADKSAVYFACTEPEAPLGPALHLAEIIIRRPANSLVILQGKQPRLEKLFGNRENIVFAQNPSEEEFFQQLENFCF